MLIHTVQSGETLRGIAEKYGTSTRELLRLNELESEDVLVVGLHLLVPSDAEKAPPQKRTIEVNGYLLPEGTPSDERILQDVPDMTYVCIFSYQVRADGTLNPPHDRLALTAASRYRIAPLMTVTNFDGNNFSTELAHTVMANGSIRRKVIENILQTMSAKGFRGVNIDFEHMRQTDRNLYNQFVRELGQAARASGKSISIALGPKTSDDPTAPWMGAFDYRTLGSEVDFMMLMTYEWGWVGGPPMAVAPIDKVRQVIEYAKSVIPSEKILMGISLYGYDWTLPFEKGKRASGLSNNAAQNLAVTKQVPIEFDAKSASPFFRYEEAGEDHIVWFDDALSVDMKFRLLDEYNLRGFSYWVLGNSFPQNWHLLVDRFLVKKL
jgi:spore germination protein